MQNFFLPQYSPDLAHSLFGSIVGLLEFFLFLVKAFEVVVFGPSDLGGAVESAPEARDLSFHCLHFQKSFFPPIPS